MIFSFFHIVFSFIVHLTWVDWLIIGVLIFYAIEGYSLGALASFLELVKFIASFAIALKFYSITGLLILRFFAIPSGIANAIAFFVTALAAELILKLIEGLVIDYVYKIKLKKLPILKVMDNFIGIIFSVISGVIFIMFLLTLIAALPVSPFLKNSVSNAEIGGVLLSKSAGFEKTIDGVFGGAAHETLNFLTVEPKSNSIVTLGFTYKKGTIDTQSEGQMLAMVNAERAKVGAVALTMDPNLQVVARAHARDMLERGYFSHYTPEGLSPFDRMAAAHITYTYAGENLAFSPNVTLSMQGLMNSPGHRENILNPHFGKIGVGVIDAGFYGQMFVQEFTD